jgi:hypothetical protein
MVLSMLPCKIIFHIQVYIYLLFFNPTHKTKNIGQQIGRWGTTNSKPPESVYCLQFYVHLGPESPLDER